MNPDPDLAPNLNSAQSPVHSLNLNPDHNHTAQTEEGPTTDQTGGQSPVQAHSPALAPSKSLVQSPAEVHSNADMCPVNGSVSSSDSEAQNPPKDQDPDEKQQQTQENSPSTVTDSTQSPGSVPNKTSYPVTLKSQNQTILLTKPGPDQSSSQSIVVRVPALALLKALVQNSGQTHVRIPLQTESAGSVLVPSTTPSNIHLTASVQSLIQHPGVVQNRVQSAGIVLSPIRNPSLVPNPVQSKGLAQNAARSAVNSPNLVSNSAQIRTLAQKSITFQTKTPVLNPALTKSFVMIQAPASNSGLDPNLVPVPLPSEAVRALSPPAKTTPLKPSVPPLGFRLNGKLIPLLPGGENVELYTRSHPPGSKSSLTSLHLGKTPTPKTFPVVPRPPVRPPHRSDTVPKKFPQSLKTTTPPLPVNKTISHPPPKPKPRPNVTLPRPRNPKLAATAAFLQKGELIQRQPPDCHVCKSKFKTVSELRGFMCNCSPEVTSALKILRLRRRDERIKFRLKKKLNLLNQHQRVSKPQPFHSYAASKSFSSLQKPLRSSEHFVSESQPSVSPGISRPRPSPSPSVSRPRPSPSPGVSRPRPSPSPVVSRPRPSPSPDVSRPRPSVSPVVQRPPRPSPSPGTGTRSEVSSPGAEVTIGGAAGRLVIHLEDFYYGNAKGDSTVAPARILTSYRCMHCSKEQPNNVSLMLHTWKHMKEHFKGYCPHCFRQFFSSDKLQHHLDAVHGPNSRSSRVVCRICEWDFETEISLLKHMKDMHKPGEMPYGCELCGFRSSFFSQTWKHFMEVHADTRYFLCQYCLRLFKMDRSYQQHVARHLRKQVYNCNRCRLQFHMPKEHQDHQAQFHRTYVRPVQLNGLRPGTMVSVRTFQVAPPESSPQTKPSAALRKIVPKAQPKQQKSLKRKAVESLGEIFSHLHRSESSSCVECLNQIQDFKSHFPTRVSCSRCRFQTCCSRAYANHMIDNHSGKKMHPLYPKVFTSCPRLDSCLECLTCGFSSQTGDVMAVHLSSNPKHICLLCPLTDGKELSDHEDEQSALGSTAGFVSIEHLSSSHLSISNLNRPAQLSSPAAMTITVTRSPHHLSKPAAPLAISRLSTLLHSLLHGAAATSKLYGVSQSLIGRWAREQRKILANRRWRWDTGVGARWVLTEREQNHIVTQEAIMDLSLRTLGPKIPLQTRLSWAVDFLLRHDLGLETRSKELRDIGYSAVTSTWDKVNSLHLLPTRFCCLDEFPVFMDPGALSSLGAEALRVWGHREERPLVEVLLCGASDGSLLTPMLFYNKELPPLPRGFPTNVFIQAREGGYSLRDRARLWAHKVWLPHLGDTAPSMLLLDEHCGHMTADFVDPLQHSCTELVYIPPGCGFLVQPLDQCVAPVVRNFLKVRWSQLVAQNPPDFNESDLILTLGCWFSEVSAILNSNKNFIHRSFLCVGTRYKTAEITQHTLNLSLHQALIQTAPPRPAYSQPAETEEEGLSLSALSQLEEPEGEGLSLSALSQSEESEEVGLQTETQSEEAGCPMAETEVEVMEVDNLEIHEGTGEAGLYLEPQSEALEETEEAGLRLELQSEAEEETEEVGLRLELQSEAEEETEEAGLHLELESEAEEETEEAELRLELQSEAEEETEEAGLHRELESEAQEETEEAGLKARGKTEAQEVLEIFEGVSDGESFVAFE